MINCNCIYMISNSIYACIMVKIIIDLPPTLICASDIEIQPLQLGFSNQAVQSQDICLSLIVLFLPYAYLLYLHVSCVWTLNSRGLLKQLDGLDVCITFISMLRILCMFLFPAMRHSAVLIILAILALAWQLALLLVYLKFVIQNRRKWIIISALAIISYITYILLTNYFYHSRMPDHTNALILPIFYPLFLCDFTISLVAIYQFLSIEKALTQRLLTPNIVIQLKNRRSFIFQTLSTCWVSLFMRKYPDIFMPIVGVVLFYLISQWLNIAIIFRCIVHRILRSIEESELDQDEATQNKRNSNLIVVEMQDYAYRRN